MKRYFLKGARDFLEEQYNNIIQTMTKNNLQKAQLGGRPTTIAFVKGYLNILFNIPTQPFPDEYEVRNPTSKKKMNFENPCRSIQMRNLNNIIRFISLYLAIYTLYRVYVSKTAFFLNNLYFLF